MPPMKHIIIYDIEDKELIDFPWYEDEEVPPVVKPKVKKKEEEEEDAEKKRRPCS